MSGVPKTFLRLDDSLDDLKDLREVVTLFTIMVYYSKRHRLKLEKKGCEEWISGGSRQRFMYLL